MELHSHRENFLYPWKILEEQHKQHENSIIHFMNVILQN